MTVDAMTEVRYSAGDRIIQQGEPGNSFYMIRYGEVAVSISEQESPSRTGGKSKGWEKEVTKLGAGKYFGEIALMEEHTMRTASVTASELTVCYTLDRTTFTKVREECMLHSKFMREAARRKQQVADLLLERSEASPAGSMTPSPTAQRAGLDESTPGRARRKRSEDATASTRKFAAKDMREVGVLGKGTFGKVNLVEHRPSKMKFAMKAMRKDALIDQGQVEHVLAEKDILSLCSHPFIIKLEGAFMDDVKLYMILELALGGELFTLLHSREPARFDEPSARFYAANVVSAFFHLHDHKIAYRDLKPENLLLDSYGYLKIVDFGFAKIIEERTFTLCGTPEYFAPEIIANVGHGLPVDWWALGILVYEMLTGHPPFHSGPNEDPLVLYDQIHKGNVHYPKKIISNNSKDLLINLLRREPPLRLGIVKRGHRDLVEHPFFHHPFGIDMNNLAKRLQAAPFVPTIRSDEDLSNFEFSREDDGDNSQANHEGIGLKPLTKEQQQLFASFVL